jgi:hypothetical protein
MSRRSQRDNQSTMLDLWRPPTGAGDPVGCLASTYTFSPGLFDEQCLGRFLGIESEPQRESLAYLLERESRLGTCYAGVLVDATQAGVQHSLRWDVLPVRVPTGKQHAKVSLLAWANHARLIVASANLTEPGYRSNFEVAALIDFTTTNCDASLLADAIAFLRSLISLVPGSKDLAETKRASDFLRRIESLSADWKPGPRGGLVRHRLACSLPGRGEAARSALEEYVTACRGRGSLPCEYWIASPFFDDGPTPNRAAEAICRQMARGADKAIWLCVPGSREAEDQSTLIHAPRAVYDTLLDAGAKVSVELVPDKEDGERRKWHAKMIHAVADGYVALMAGSSNFTAAGLGLIPTRNAEANLVTIVDRVAHAREEGLLRAVWEAMVPVEAPDRGTWQQPADDDDEGKGLPVPSGFLAATYFAGQVREIVLRLDPERLPGLWTVQAAGGLADGQQVISANEWQRNGGGSAVEVAWPAYEPPERLRIDWADQHAFLPLNVADAMSLPEPSELREMTADEMLAIIAASDPGAALRAWGNRRQPADPTIDPDLDAATPIDLDPLSRYRLTDTFLHRVRRRAHVMADLRRFIERPVATEQMLEWRLRGLIGIRPLAEKFAREFETAATARDPREALMTLADLLIVLREARYEPADGAISKQRFTKLYQSFLKELSDDLDGRVGPRLVTVGTDIAAFWAGVLERCRT